LRHRPGRNAAGESEGEPCPYNGGRWSFMQHFAASGQAASGQAAFGQAELRGGTGASRERSSRRATHPERSPPDRRRRETHRPAGQAAPVRLAALMRSEIKRWGMSPKARRRRHEGARPRASAVRARLLTRNARTGRVPNYSAGAAKLTMDFAACISFTSRASSCPGRLPRATRTR
jgi:hypothetical protein